MIQPRILKNMNLQKYSLSFHWLVFAPPKVLCCSPRVSYALSNHTTIEFYLNTSYHKS